MKNDNGKTKKDHEKKQKETAENVSSHLTELERLLEETELKYKRALADYQNLEKRVQEEKGSWIRLANKNLLLRLLPVLDTLMLAAKHAEDQTLQVTLQQFLSVLQNEGVTKIETEGKEFDPKTMECVVTEDGEEGKVLEELRAGFMLSDTVLRPAQVKVGRKGD